MGFDPPVPRTQPSHFSHMLPLQATKLSVTLTQTCICSEEWVFCSRLQWCGTTTNNTALSVTHKTQLCQLPTKHSSVSYPQQTTQLCQLPTKHSSVSYPQQTTQLCQLPTKHSSFSYPQNTVLSVTHKTQLFQLPTKQHGSVSYNKQHSSVSYPQNTALSASHKTTQLCQLPTKHSSVSYPQNNMALSVTHKTQLSVTHKTQLSVTHKTQFCQLPTKHSCQLPTTNTTALSVTHNKHHSSVSYPQNNMALSVTHKTQLSVTHNKHHSSVSYPQQTPQLCQLPTKHSSVSYPQNNTALSVTHKTTWLPTNLSRGTWTGTIILTSLRASCARARKDSSTPMMVIRINTMSTSVRENTHYYQASTQSLHLLEKIHITKHQHKVYIC